MGMGKGRIIKDGPGVQRTSKLHLLGAQSFDMLCFVEAYYRTCAVTCAKQSICDHTVVDPVPVAWNIEHVHFSRVFRQVR